MNYHAIAQASKASQDKEELEELLKIVDEEDPRQILEIGVDQGYSLDVWNKAFSPSLLIGIDIIEPQREIDHLFIKGNSGEKWIVNLVEKLADMPNSYSWGIDFLFLDGDHHYEAVKKDFELYSPLVRKGGIVAFHDARITDNNTVEVYKFWNEIKQQYKHKEIFSSTGTGTGVLWM